MHRSLIGKEVIPFFMLLGSLILATIISDALLHYLDMVWVGRYLGIPGTLLILLSFIYSLRKRHLIKVSSPKKMLSLHETLTWIGGLMVLVHAGIHVYAILPWLALFAMVLNLISGMTGKYLLQRSRTFLSEKQEAYSAQGISGEELEKKLFWDANTYDLMDKWRVIHMPISLAFAVLGLTHIISILLFWEWK
jgi:hypothetical protein